MQVLDVLKSASQQRTWFGCSPIKMAQITLAADLDMDEGALSYKKNRDAQYLQRRKEVWDIKRPTNK